MATWDIENSEYGMKYEYEVLNMKYANNRTTIIMKHHNEVCRGANFFIFVVIDFFFFLDL